MSISKAQKAGAALGAVVLASSAMAVAPVIVNGANTAEVQGVETPAPEASETIDVRTPVPVKGEFAYAQDKVTDTSTLANVFSRAAATLCQTLPEYVAPDGDFEVTSNNMSSSYLEWIKSAGKKSAEASTQLLACVCASNLPGGGAAANVEVSGVTVESIAQEARAL